MGADNSTANSYLVAFTQTEHGRRVLQHLMDEIYCTVYEGKDPNEALAHNARRSVVHEIITNIDLAQFQQRYIPEMVVESPLERYETNGR